MYLLVALFACIPADAWASGSMVGVLAFVVVLPITVVAVMIYMLHNVSGTENVQWLWALASIPFSIGAFIFVERILNVDRAQEWWPDVVAAFTVFVAAHLIVRRRNQLEKREKDETL